MNNLVQQISNSKSIDQQIADLEAQINLLKAEKEYEKVWNQALAFSSYSDRIMFIREVTTTPVVNNEPVRKIIYQDCGIYNEEVYSEIVDVLISSEILNNDGLALKCVGYSILTGLCARIYHSTAMNEEFRKKNNLAPHVREFTKRHMGAYNFTSVDSFAASVGAIIRRRNANKGIKTTSYDYLEIDSKTGKYTFKYKY